MPDISKCNGSNCPLKETCYRYTSPSDHRQSYFAAPPLVDGKCEYFIDDKLREKDSSYFGKQCYLNGPIICKFCEKEPLDCECVMDKPRERTNKLTTIAPLPAELHQALIKRFFCD